MRTGRPKKPLEISDPDREKLRRIAARPKSTQAMALRVRIVLHGGRWRPKPACRRMRS
jgi:hypothetical protein